MSTRMFILLAAVLAAYNVSQAASLREQRFQLSIKKGSLTTVLEQFSQQTGIHIGTELSAVQAKARRYGPLKARAVTADEAIRTLLKNSDLWYAWREEDTIRLFLISGQRTNWSSGVSTAKEASDSIRGLAGVRYDTGRCGKLPVGPFESKEPITAEAFWLELIKPYCEVIRQPSVDIQAGSIEGDSVAGQTEHDFSIPAQSRLRALQRIAEQAGVIVDYISSDADEERALLPSISGVMPLNQALRHAMRESVLRLRWISEDRVSVEPAYAVVAFADMSQCDCNFGLPEWRGVQGAEVVVERSRFRSSLLASLTPVAVYDRRFIDNTGASSIPELLNTLSQQAFSRPRGFQPNGAQYFEGRGFGAPYALVLINGHRAYGSAADPITNAFDLNVVPLSAVDHLEIALDQPSVRYGMDAFGGTVNVVLKDHLEKDELTLTAGSAAGGAEKMLATLAVDDEWRGWNTGFVFDHLNRGELLGSKRDRWRNQDYTRLSPHGDDYRFGGVLPNVYAIGDVLPLVHSSSAGFARSASGLTPQANLINRQSALAYMGIEPEQQRSSVYGFANTASKTTELRLGVLYGDQTAKLRLFPVTVPGLTWGTAHPQNPFGRDVLIETMLTGLPARTHNAESNLKRLTADLTHDFGPFKTSAFAIAQQDRTRNWLENDVNLSVLMDSLKVENGVTPLNVLNDRPGAGPVPARLLLERQVNRYKTEALQMGLTASAKPVGDVELDVGTEYRKEAAVFDPQVGRRDREIKSFFSHVRVPLIRGTETSPPLELAAGVRHDVHSDVRDITTWQSGLIWRPIEAVQLFGSYSTLFRPPSLYELYLPRFSLPSQIVDPQRGNEATEITLVTGGNPALAPTDGQSFELGISWAKDTWETSLKYWDTQMGNRVSAALVPDLLNAHDDVGGRITREDETGRLLSLDISFGNFGAVKARGFDFSFKRTLDTRIGWLTPRIDITRTVDFRYRDRPAASVPLLDRAGIASIYGTVPSGRAVASLILEKGSLSIAAYIRHHSSYKDYSIVAGAVTRQRVSAQTLLDLKITQDISDHLTLSIGANNVLDDQPPFAQSGGWEGFDQTQGNLLGREAFLEITKSF